MESSINLTRVSFSATGASLAGVVYDTVDPRGMTIVLAHGFTGSKESLDPTASYLCSRGWRCLTFDFRGHKLGGSSGVMDGAEAAINDLAAAVAFARERWRVQPIVLVGHSMGGTVGLALAASDPDIAGVAALGIGVRGELGFDTPAGQALLEQRSSYVEGAPAQEVLSQAAIRARAAEHAEHIRLLLIAARNDVIVRAESVRGLLVRFPGRASCIQVDGGHMDLPIRCRGHLAEWLEALSAESRGSRIG